MDWLTDPDRLWNATKLGREEYMQRLLASLVLGEATAGWNRRRAPSSSGADFLRALHALRFDATPDDPPVFVDEFELPARDESERAGWPDHAVVWPDHLVLIELKTERRSHRVDQLPYYLELARHHHPSSHVDLLYITPTMKVVPPDPLPDRVRYGWLPWTEVAALVLGTWGDADSWESAVAERLAWWVEQCEAAAPLPVRVSQPPLPSRPAASEAPGHPARVARKGEGDAVHDPLLLARDVQEDGQQRAIKMDATDPDDLEALRLELRDRLMAGPTVEGTPVTHVRPWIWRQATSGGQALSALGQETGYELRLSRYAQPQV